MATVGHIRTAILASLLLLFFSAVPSSGVKRSTPIRIRENLWATGGVDPDNIPEGFNPMLTDVFENAKGLLMRELLKTILQQRLLDEEREKGDAEGQETPSLMKLLEKYI